MCEELGLVNVELKHLHVLLRHHFRVRARPGELVACRANNIALGEEVNNGAKEVPVVVKGDGLEDGAEEAAAHVRAAEKALVVLGLGDLLLAVVIKHRNEIVFLIDEEAHSLQAIRNGTPQP